MRLRVGHSARRPTHGGATDRCENVAWGSAGRRTATDRTPSVSGAGSHGHASSQKGVISRSRRPQGLERGRSRRRTARPGRSALAQERLDDVVIGPISSPAPGQPLHQPPHHQHGHRDRARIARSTGTLPSQEGRRRGAQADTESFSGETSIARCRLRDFNPYPPSAADKRRTSASSSIEEPVTTNPPIADLP